MTTQAPAPAPQANSVAPKPAIRAESLTVGVQVLGVILLGAVGYFLRENNAATERLDGTLQTVGAKVEGLRSDLGAISTRTTLLEAARVAENVGDRIRALEAAAAVNSQRIATLERDAERVKEKVR